MEFAVPAAPAEASEFDFALLEHESESTVQVSTAALTTSKSLLIDFDATPRGSREIADFGQPDA